MMHWSCHYYNSIGPSSPPQNIMATDVDPASLMITWEPPSLEHQNGPISGYYVRIYLTDSFHYGYGTRVRTGVTLTNLIPFVSYVIQVAARNVNGTGVFSSRRNQVSGQAGK